MSYWLASRASLRQEVHIVIENQCHRVDAKYPASSPCTTSRVSNCVTHPCSSVLYINTNLRLVSKKARIESVRNSAWVIVETHEFRQAEVIWLAAKNVTRKQLTRGSEGSARTVWMATKKVGDSSPTVRGHVDKDT